MKRRLAACLVIHRRFTACLLALFALVSVFFIGSVRINYDFTSYLRRDTLTRRSLELMEREFGNTEQLRIMFTDRTEERFEEALAALRENDRIAMVSYREETDHIVRGGQDLRAVTLLLGDGDPVETARLLREQFPERDGCLVGGSSANTLDIRSDLSHQVVLAMIIAVIAVAGILLLTSRAWLEPIPVLAVLLTGILLNLGTNWILGEISFVTFAVCAILQLALSMDYSIMLMHAWHGCMDAGSDPVRAMEQAVAQSLMPILSSSLTTAAGLMALMFMSFTIGFDIGMSLVKGIALSMLSVFLMMPALLIGMNGVLKRSSHRTVPLGGSRIAGFVTRFRIPLAIVLSLTVICGIVLQGGSGYLFTDPTNSGPTARIIAAFGESNSVAVLVPCDGTKEDFARQRDLLASLEQITYRGHPAVKQVTSMVTTGEAALKQYTPEDVAALTGYGKTLVRLFFRQHGLGESVRGDELLALAQDLMGDSPKIRELGLEMALARQMLLSDHCSRIILTMDMPYLDDDVCGVIERIIDVTEAAYPGAETGIVGSSVAGRDISDAFSSDLMLVNFLTAAAILLIVALSFRSLRAAILLVAVIWGSIQVSMAISAVQGKPVFFMSYLICVAMQMGATADYGILLTDRYRAARTLLGRQDALKRAVSETMPTVCTSGLILIIAGAAVGRVCTVFYVSSIGNLLARGAAVSIVLILTLLPALLILTDRVGDRNAEAGTTMITGGTDNVQKP